MLPVKVYLSFGLVCLLDVVVLTLGEHEKCRDQICSSGTFCSKLEGSCVSCEKICTNDHNYDDQQCHSLCKDWISDNKRNMQTVEIQELKSNIKDLKSLVKASFIISGIAILLSCVLVLFLTYKWCQRKGFKLDCLSIKLKHDIKKPTNTTNNNKSEPPNNLSDVKVQATRTNGDLHLQISDNSPSDTMVETAESPQTISTSISRRGAPSESRALDYAYDNPAMSIQATKGSRDSSF